MARPIPQVDELERSLLRFVAARPLHAGDRLPPERELADRLGVSRPAIREAISRLAADGVTESRHGSGTFLAEIDVAAVTEVRLLLEPEAASRAASRRRETDIALLQGKLAAMRRSLNEPDQFAALDAEIHALIAGTCGNPVLQDVLGRLTRAASLARSVTSRRRAVRRAALDDLEAVVEAIAEQRPEAAGAAMRCHLKRLASAEPAS
jgi:GntR family transcriptional repressor for pyruvate dehydrogenase complex